MGTGSVGPAKASKTRNSTQRRSPGFCVPLRKKNGMKIRIEIAWMLVVLILLTACSSSVPAPKDDDGTAPTSAPTGTSAQEAAPQERETADPLPAACTLPETLPASEPAETSAEDTPAESEAPEPWDWSFGTPESQGMNAAALSALHKTYDSFPLLSAVIVRNGVIVDTYYKDGYDESSVYTLQSTSKSITGALVGIALASGDIETVDEPLSDYFPELLSASDPRWADITIRHLLTHTSGIASTDSAIWYEWRGSENWLDYLFALPIRTAPGTNFDYSTGNTHLLSAVLERATGKPLGDYAREVLFEPLGMTSAGVYTAPEGVGDGGNGFYMTTSDLARFGLLYLNGGVWEGRQIVPAAWVEASTTMQAKRTSDGSRYGYQWWVRTFSSHEAFVAQGHYGQYIIAVPDLSLLLAINSNYEGSSKIYWQIANDAIAGIRQ